MRKCLLLAMAVCCMSVIANAQIQKGSVLLGGNISAGTGKQNHSNWNNEQKQTNFNISPALGFVTANNKVWGFTLSTGFSKSKGTNVSEEMNYNSYGGSVFHRRYLTLGKGFYLFGQADAGYYYSKQKYQTNGNTMSRTMRTDVVSVSAFPGITYAVSKNFHLEAGLNNLVNLSYMAYNDATVNGGPANSVKGKNFSLGTNLSNSNPLSIGFRFVL